MLCPASDLGERVTHLYIIGDVGPDTISPFTFRAVAPVADSRVATGGPSWHR